MAPSDSERYPLTVGPSPVHELKRLSEHLDGARVWAKRGDCTPYRVRRSQDPHTRVHRPDALASGAGTLLSIGGVQSNHTRQVAGVAAHLALKAVLVRWPA